MTRPDDACYRIRMGSFRLLRIALAVGLVVVLAFGPAVVAGSAWPPWLSALLFYAGLLALWAMRDLPLYPAGTFGIDHRVDEDTFDGPRKRCTECGARTKQGLRRRYARQLVVLGVPLSTLDWGINDYCLECAEPGGGPGVDPDSGIGRVRRNDESAERALDRAFDRS